MKKTVTLELDKMSFLVEGSNDEELLENAKNEMIKQLQIQFPRLTYSIDDADVLTLKDIYPGMIVESDGRVGIVNSINVKNKRPVNVTFKGGINVSGTPQAFKKSNATFEEARSLRRMKDEWYTGDSGYLKVNTDIVEVIVGKTAKDKLDVHVVNQSKGFVLKGNQIEAFLKDNKEEF